MSTLGRMRRVGVSLLSQVLSIVLNLVSAVVLARWLGPSGKGVFSILLSTTALLAVAYGVGSVPAMSTWVSRKLVGLDTAFVVSLAIAVCAAVLSYLTITLVPHLTPEGITPWSVCAMVGTIVLSQLQMAAAQGRGAVTSIAINSVLSLLVQLVLIAAISRAVSSGPREAVYAWLVSQNFGTAVAWINARSGEGRPRISRIVDGRGMLRFGWAAMPAQILTATNARLDIIILGVIAASAVAGYYSLATTGSQLLLLVPAAAAQAFASEFGEGVSSEGLVQMLRMVFVVTLVLAALMGVFAGPVIHLILGAEYDPVIPMLWIMIPGMVLYSLVPLATSYFWHASTSAKEPNVIVGVSVVIDVALLAILVPRFGAQGAALAASIAYFVSGLSCVGMLCRTLDCGFREVLVPRAADLRYLWRIMWGRAGADHARV